MSEIYWLTRLDSIQGFFITALAIGAAVTVICWVIKMVCSALADDGTKVEENKTYVRNAKANLRWSIPAFVLGLLGVCFVPTSKDALLIWGVGGSIDYLKENPTAKQLPDKVINILDEWIDELAPDKGRNNK